MAFRSSLLIAFFGLANMAAAADEPQFVSKTFQEIQSRVLHRDAECGAILQVKVKEDAPQLSFGLDFSIQEVAGEAVVVLSRNLKAGDGVYEKYRLRFDDALREELQKQKQLKVLEAKRSAALIEDRKKQITKLTNGQLRYGMSLKEVIKVKGQPEKVESWQAAGAFTAIYPDMNLNFWTMKLTDIKTARK